MFYLLNFGGRTQSDWIHPPGDVCTGRMHQYDGAAADKSGKKHFSYRTGPIYGSKLRSRQSLNIAPPYTIIKGHRDNTSSIDGSTQGASPSLFNITSQWDSI